MPDHTDICLEKSRYKPTKKNLKKTYKQTTNADMF